MPDESTVIAPNDRLIQEQHSFRDRLNTRWNRIRVFIVRLLARHSKVSHEIRCGRSVRNWALDNDPVLSHRHLHAIVMAPAALQLAHPVRIIQRRLVRPAPERKAPIARDTATNLQKAVKMVRGVAHGLGFLTRPRFAVLVRVLALQSRSGLLADLTNLKQAMRRTPPPPPKSRSEPAPRINCKVQKHTLSIIKTVCVPSIALPWQTCRDQSCDRNRIAGRPSRHRKLASWSSIAFAHLLPRAARTAGDQAAFPFAARDSPFQSLVSRVRWKHGEARRTLC
jgi:hypothetical protein